MGMIDSRRKSGQASIRREENTALPFNSVMAGAYFLKNLPKLRRSRCGPPAGSRLSLASLTFRTLGIFEGGGSVLGFRADRGRGLWPPPRGTRRISSGRRAGNSAGQVGGPPFFLRKNFAADPRLAGARPPVFRSQNFVAVISI